MTDTAAGAADPFAPAASAGSESEPFAAAPVSFEETAGGDPFAAPAELPETFPAASFSAVDPFAGDAFEAPAAEASPFAAAAAEPNPFLAEAGSQPADPFAAASQPFATSFEPHPEPVVSFSSAEPEATPISQDPLNLAGVAGADPFLSQPEAAPLDVFGSGEPAIPSAELSEAQAHFAPEASAEPPASDDSFDSVHPFAVGSPVTNQPFPVAELPAEIPSAEPVLARRQAPAPRPPAPEPERVVPISSTPLNLFAPMMGGLEGDPFRPAGLGLPPSLESAPSTEGASPLSRSSRLSTPPEGGLDPFRPAADPFRPASVEAEPADDPFRPAPARAEAEVHEELTVDSGHEPLTVDEPSAAVAEAAPAEPELPEPTPILVEEPIVVEDQAPAIAEAPINDEPIFSHPRASFSVEAEVGRDQVEQARRVREANQGADIASLIRAYRRAIEESPDNLLLRTDLADLHLNYGLLEDAVVQYRQIIKRSPQSVGLHHRLVQAHLWNDNHEEAASTLMDLASIHQQRGEMQDALDTIQTTLSLDPHHFLARRQLVNLCTSQGESKLAAHHLRQLAESALTKGNVDEAIDAFSRLMQISDDPSFQDRLAQVYESQGRTEEALHHYRELTARYTAAQQWEEAASATERIVTLQPDDLATRAQLTELYQRLGLTDRVLEQKYQLASHYLQVDQVAEAASLLEQVLADKPDHQAARRSLIDVYLQQNRVDEALKQAAPLTAYYAETQNAAEAIVLYGRLIDAQPDNPELRKQLIHFYGMAGDTGSAAEQWLALAQLFCRHEDWQQGVEAYHRVLELDENRPEIHYQLARLYLEKLNNTNRALQEYARVYELDPGNTQAMAKYVRILLRLSKADQAAAVLKRLAEVNPEADEVRASVMKDFRSRIEAEPTDLRARFVFGELCFHLGEVDLAIEQFQQTRRDRAFELKSYNMLGLSFAEKTGFNMHDLAIRQFRKGLETAGFSEQEYLELRYNLAMLQYRSGRLQEALQELKDCYAVDIAYRDVREWIRRIENELAGGAKPRG